MTVDPSAMTEAGEGAAAIASGELVAGASLGKYRLDRVLGAGGMGVVWAAFDPDLERAVAIKVLRSADSTSTLRTRLLREARAMARLKHPNVLTVYEVGTDRNRDYIAMELIDGADLDRWLGSRPASDEVFAALLAAGRGLAAAHDAGLIHRDLKPHNILRGTDGGVYVTDFGLARGQIDDSVELLQTPVAQRGALDSPLTQTGMLIGTPAYMAPEQFAGRAPDPRSDQFAFCVTAWEALTGARPFAGKDLDALKAASASGASGAQGSAVLPPAVRAVLGRGLSPDPADRWPDMRTTLRELEAALIPAAPRRSSLRRFIAIAPVVAAMIAGVALFVHTRNLSSRAAAGDCVSADEAFGSAWNAERRAAVTAQHRQLGQIMGVTAMLDSARADWKKAYTKACARPSSAERHEQLSCLLSARDEIDEATRELLDPDVELSAGNLVSLNITVGGCEH
ncbi:MAG TPA: serine/threonine-protein kinase [Kofleriaceae bacterium]